MPPQIKKYAVYFSIWYETEIENPTENENENKERAKEQAEEYFVDEAWDLSNFDIEIHEIKEEIT
jgi:hypothetical protein